MNFYSSLPSDWFWYKSHLYGQCLDCN